jgi:hypothetical protein
VDCSESKKAPPERGFALDRPSTSSGRQEFYFVVVVVVSRLVAVPIGVSTVVFDRVVVVLSFEGGSFDLVVSTATVVEDEAGGVAGCTTVVEEVAGGAGSFTTVVEVDAGRSQPKSAAAVSRAMAGRIFFMRVSSGDCTPLRQRMAPQISIPAA